MSNQRMRWDFGQNTNSNRLAEQRIYAAMKNRDKNERQFSDYQHVSGKHLSLFSSCSIIRRATRTTLESSCFARPEIGYPENPIKREKVGDFSNERNRSPVTRVASLQTRTGEALLHPTPSTSKLNIDRSELRQRLRQDWLLKEWELSGGSEELLKSR